MEAALETAKQDKRTDYERLVEKLTTAGGPAVLAEDAMLEIIDSSPYSATACDYCELWHLSRTVFYGLLDNFPAACGALPEIRKRVERITSGSGSAENINPPRLRAERYIHPKGSFHKCWNIVLLFFILYERHHGTVQYRVR